MIIKSIPKSWEIKSLEELLIFVIGGDWGKDETHTDNEYDLAYCIRGSEIKNWELDRGKTASLRKIKKTNIEKRKLQFGDILVEISGGGPEQPVGRTVLIDNISLNHNKSVPKICTNFLRLIRPNENINSKFLNLYLKLFYYSGEIVKYQAGSNNLRNLKFPDYLKIKIPLPPLETQQAIVSKIEELFSELDKGIEDLKMSQLQLKTYRQSVLKWAFEGKLTNENVKDGKLPEGWKTVKVSEIAKIETGTTPSKNNSNFYGNEFPFYKPTDLEAGKNVFKSKDGLTELGIKHARYVPEFSTLVTCIGATIGKTGFIKTGGGFNQQINAIVPNNAINPLFVYYQSIGLNFQQQIIDNSSATTLPIINKSKFQLLKMVICNLNEQNLIVQEIESRLSVADKMEESITQSLLQAEALRQSILKKAFSGELV
jgi:restriction endonuclease S subunit